MSGGKGKLAAAAAIMAVAGSFVVHALLPDRSEAGTPAMVQRTRLRIAPEVTGRLARILVTSGQSVHAGDTLALLDNPELAATLDEARAAAASAAADRDRVFSGIRREEVEIAARAVEAAQAKLLLAQQMHDRAATLSGRGFSSLQALNEATAQLDKARADLESRKAEHAAEQAGPTAEERALAEAKVAQAQAILRDVEAQLGKIRLVAPRDAVVGTLVGMPGEIVPAGRPVLTLDLGDDLFFALSIREDRLGGLGIGERRDLVDPGGRRIPAQVTEMRPLGEFATWRAARAVGDHDLNTFRIRFEPLEPVTDLQPGMTVWLSPVQAGRRGFN